MKQSTQDFSARRFHVDNYDCELPASVRTELFTPKRPRILGRPRTGSIAPRWALYVLLLAAIITIVGLLASRHGEGTSQNALATKQSALSTPTPQPAVVPSPTPGAARSWRAFAAQHPEQFPYRNPAPRAVLVKLPPPRAQLIRLPEWKPGEERQLLMPYQIKVLGRLRGRLESEAMLPADGNAIGDAWAVGDNVWVWLTAPGATHADWIDP